MKKISIQSDKPVLQAKLFTVSEIKLSLPEGTKYSHIVARRYPTVCVFPITNVYEIYLVSQYRYLLEKETLESVAGFIDKGETTIEAAQRELKEETGIEALQFEEIARLDLSGSVFKAIVHLFLAKGLEFGKAQPEEDECIQLVKIPLTEAVKKVISGEISDASTVSGILLLETLRRQKNL
ncbi:MAG: hypothetical protein A3F31_03810 [Candidatus Levybacteria bacterium RIFCSPHIGHO2_12_FULL_38_12]|nr:MAG: hypothetical protein A2770_02205 [Candidatus Levybacteria bacterium RIFCSPHIGHO2_01_FULL_38_12]OGH21891.1 MAG: hypothetical protein A3D75_00425 [Candidatus Levybacteria bacterium RIFCSPHIGHO2_02_FULL_37_18]OGH22823.1 MAG: hypothetical protein A3F31_03810 [Candidatus Levybacteria bacterium RIFCSPHIGHO2_12_FULL_38_12]OGH33548.1 MAG: hypothetical protein A3A47_01770 [Candidatus Levybacteria bacterium RIFCSPLOWO2_01_FULL_37_20]OGH44469.1 MAG: hypothetical protein A3J14_03460 [Candidatus Lev